jgi:hypothetical protein
MSADFASHYVDTSIGIGAYLYNYSPIMAARRGSCWGRSTCNNW